MFLFKKIVGTLLMPYQLGLAVALAGLALLLFTRKQKAGKILTAVGLIFLTVMGYGGVSNRLLRHFEYAYPPFQPEKYMANADAPVKYIVVLGGGHVSDPYLPITSQINGSSLTRLVEGIRLHRNMPGTRLVLSGGVGFDPTPNAEIMARMAEQLGVARSEMILETESRDTKDEARLLEPILGTDPFIMVTTASHIPRSAGLFKKRGMHPIPAPTDHHVRRRQGGVSPGSFFPDLSDLYKSQKAFYEFLGTLWARLRGQSD